MLRQVILAKESFLTDATLVGLHARMPLLVPPHVGAIGKFHLEKKNRLDFTPLTLRKKTKINTENNRPNIRPYNQIKVTYCFNCEANESSTFSSAA